MATTTTNGTVRVTSEPLTYRAGGEFSYFADLTLAEHPERERGNQSRERLLRHERKMQIDTGRRLRPTLTRRSGW